jgi:hypothetical protein
VEHVTSDEFQLDRGIHRAAPPSCSTVTICRGTGTAMLSCRKAM